jgi:hypothetical protein
VLVFGADRLADEDRAGGGEAERGHEGDAVDLDDGHHRGDGEGAEAGEHDVDEDDEGGELEEPVEAAREAEAEHAHELGEAQAQRAGRTGFGVGGAGHVAAGEHDGDGEEADPHGDRRGDRGALDAERGEAEVAVDETQLRPMLTTIARTLASSERRVSPRPPYQLPSASVPTTAPVPSRRIAM